MLNSIATGLAPRLSLPTGLATLATFAGRAAALATLATFATLATLAALAALATWRLHGLPGLQLPLLGSQLCGRHVCSNERRVPFNPEPGE